MKVFNIYLLNSAVWEISRYKFSNAKYIHSDYIKEEFLFCSVLNTLLKKLKIYHCKDKYFLLADYSERTSIGLTQMEHKSEFQTKVKELVPHTKRFIDMIFPVRIFQLLCKRYLNYLIQIVNYIISEAPNTYLFNKLCKGIPRLKNCGMVD